MGLHPVDEVLPYYTDETLLSGESFFKGDVRDALLSIPPEYRQPVMAQHHRMTTETTMDPTSGLLKMYPTWSDPAQVLADLVAQVHAATGGPYKLTERGG